MVKDPGKTRDGKMRFVSYKQPGMQSIAISRLLFIIVFFISISPLYGSDQEIFDADSWSKSYQKCIAGNCLNGKGTMVLYSIQKYIGEFKEGRRHGQGTMRYPDGRVYKGEFKIDTFSDGCSLILPIYEDLFINVMDSFVNSKIVC